MSDEQKILEFISVTSVDQERATFYLQSANWELHTALETFYDNDGTDIEEDVTVQPAPQSTVQPLQPPSSATATPSNRKEKERKVTEKFATLSQYQSDNASGEDDGQAFYAGGSERSGQQIIGPDKRKNPTQALFDAAKAHGAEAVSDDRSENTKPNKSFLFQGAGFKLGSDIEPSKQVSASLKPGDLPTAPQNVKIKFWKNGFSIDDGPLRDFNDPSNKDFLDSISRGEVPSELRNEVHQGEVHVDMEDHREEDYIKPKQTLKAFSGAGHKLGSPVPQVIENVPSAATRIPNRPTFKIDDTQPITNIQIRLADGTRLVSKFNHNNTVGDIRELVRNARPNTGNFNLMTTFPNKILSDDSCTISDAKLLNAVIVQKMI